MNKTLVISIVAICFTLLAANSVSAAVGSDSEESKNAYLQIGTLSTGILNAINIQSTQSQAQQIGLQAQSDLAKQQADNQKYLQEVGQQIIQSGTRRGGMTPVAAPTAPATPSTTAPSTQAAPAAPAAPTAPATPPSGNVSTSPTPAATNNSGNSSSTNNSWNYGF
ncbi:MAG: hypothetical protein HKM04_08275 [Legionellales bacterium]|nr:hypothetical protein [Legionellales bacterium]